MINGTEKIWKFGETSTEITGKQLESSFEIKGTVDPNQQVNFTYYI
jgi:hypothetical protein